MSALPDILPSQPEVINHRYVLHEAVGQGGMGTVFTAEDRLTRQMVAIKRLTIATQATGFAPQAEFDDFRLALAQEFRLMATLRHPHIISVLDYGFDSMGQPYIVMEYLPNARTFLEAGRDQPRTTQVALVMQLLQALRYLHRQGVIHRDLKPGNILVVNNVVKVLDFGLAIRHEENSVAVAGTLPYMSPEILMGAAPTQASDLYSVGVIAYELFVGHHPLDLTSPAGIMQQILTAAPDFAPLAALQSEKLSRMVRRLLAKEPLERFTEVGEAASMASMATHHGHDLFDTPEIRESFLRAARFVGRDDELQTLVKAFQQAQQGHGSMWLVGGESGLGKSRLLDELRIRILTEGAIVLRGQAVAEGGLPYQVLREPLRWLVLTGQVNDVDAGVLLEIIPDIATLTGRPITAAPVLDDKPARMRLVTVVSHLLRQHQRPLVLVLEDLHWAHHSLAMLQDIMRFVAELPLLIIGTYRSDEYPKLPDDLPGAQVLALHRLSPEAIKAFSLSIFGDGGGSKEVIEILQRESSGNALFLVEVARVLAEDLKRTEDIGHMTLPEHLIVGAIKEIVVRRIERIPAKLHDLLYPAAVAGKRLDLTLLRHILPESIRLEETLSLCSQYAILEVVENSWAFAHDRLREALLTTIPPDQLPGLHQRVAEAIETIYPDNAAYAPALTRHWRAAGDVKREIQYSQTWARQELRTDNNNKVIEIVDRVLGLLEENAPETLPFIYMRAEAQRALSQFEIAKQAFNDCVVLAEKAGDTLMHAKSLSRLGLVAENQSDYDQAAVYHRQALALLPAESNRHERARIQVSLGVVLQRQGKYDEALVQSQEALDVFREEGYSSGIASTLSDIGVVLMMQGNRIEASDRMEESLSIRRTLGYPFAIAVSLNNLGMLLEDMVDLKAALACYEEALSICRELGNQFAMAAIVGNLAPVSAKLDKNNVRALQYARESLTIARSIGDKRGIASALTYVSLYERDSDTASALQHAQEALEIASAIGEQLMILLSHEQISLTHSAMKDYAAARLAMIEALRTLQTHNIFRRTDDLLVQAAVLLRELNQPRHSAVTLGFLTEYSGTKSDNMDMMDELREYLTAILPPDVWTAAEAEGTALSVDEALTQTITALEGS